MASWRVDKTTLDQFGDDDHGVAEVEHDSEDFSLGDRRNLLAASVWERGQRRADDSGDDEIEAAENIWEPSNNQPLEAPVMKQKRVIDGLNVVRANSSRRKRDDVLQKLAVWLEEQGGEATNVEIALGEEVRGVCIRNNIVVEREELLFRIPRRIILDIDKLKESELGQSYELYRQHPAFSDPIKALVALLLLEASKETNSTWYPYVDTLPGVEDFNGFIDKWSEQNINRVHAPWLGTLARGKQIEIESGWTNLCEILEQVCTRKGITPPLIYAFKLLERISDCETGFDFYRWAFWCVESRAFLDRSSGAQALPILIPFADMLNHKPRGWECDTADFTEDRSFEMRANRNLHQGEEVYNSYGRRTNRELIINYGFAILNNPWDSVTINVPWALNASSSEKYEARNLVHRKLNLLQNASSTKPELGKLYLGRSPCPDLMWAMRVWTARSQAELDYFRVNHVAPMSPESERRALEAYAQALRCASHGKEENYLGCDFGILNTIQSFNCTLDNIISSHLKVIVYSLERDLKRSNSQ